MDHHPSGPSSHSTTAAPTDPSPRAGGTLVLDDDRTAQVRTFLTVEAAADLAAAGLGKGTGPAVAARRRVVAGVAVAAVLGGALFAANAVVGGPGPAGTPPAVAITQADGWTTISITDPGATPAEIEAALDAVGIDARVVAGDGHHAPLPAGGAGHHPVSSVYGLWVSTAPVGPGQDGDRAFYAVSSFDGARSGDLTGLGVDFALPDRFELASSDATVTVDPLTGADDPFHGDNPFRDTLADLGVRTGGDLPEGTVSIEDGADVAVVLYAKP